MAKRAKMDAASSQEAKGGVKADDLKRVVGEILRHKEAASESNGLAGQHAKNSIERYNLDRKALSIITGLKKSDESKRQATLRCLIEYSGKMGFFDQQDAFSDVIEVMRDIVTKADKRETDPPKSKGDDVVSSMIN
ncbi:hypothetical protein [Pararhizobium haloflavum]|uniref:hypothetical protein n=1 Tax=Pararhizobium haloflavum TaxID=2037914 RepID=UPI000C1A01E4|nr:hypothetical protein [Pararhizobium haloflavum]